MIIKLYEMKKDNKNDIIKKIVDKMVENKITTKEYYDGILLREKQASFFIGNFIAIPHAISDYSKYIKNDGIVIFRFIDGIDWDGEKVHYVIGIATKGEGHMDVLSNIANSFSDEEDTLKTLNIKLENLVDALEWK